MRKGLGLCRGTARRERSCSLAFDHLKTGRWQRSHDSVFACCGFIFIFFAVVTVISYFFEPSILMWGEEAGKLTSTAYTSDLRSSQEMSAVRQNMRILAAGSLATTTTLKLQEDVVQEHRLGREAKRVRRELEELEPEVTGDGTMHLGTNPLGLATGLQIYIYDLPPEYNVKWLNDSRCSNHLFAAEVALHQILLSSPLRTMDPEAADFFFVPVYVSCNFSENGFPSMSNATTMLRAAVDLILHDMIYWNRSGGSDHIFVASHDYGVCFHAIEQFAVAAGVPDFLQKSIILQTFGQKGDHPCQRVDNIQIPPYISPQSLQKYWEPVENQERKIWAYFRGKLELHPKNVSGNVYSKGIRTRLWQKFKKNKRFFLQRKRNEDYQSEMLHSKFCLAPLGWAPWSPRIVESVVYGCVPVIIADNIALPHSHVIDWPSISLTVAERDVDKLDQILADVVATNLTIIQQNLWNEKNRRPLLYSQPLLQGDASWNIFELLAQKKLQRQSERKTQQQDKSVVQEIQETESRKPFQSSI